LLTSKNKSISKENIYDFVYPNKRKKIIIKLSLQGEFFFVLATDL